MPTTHIRRHNYDSHLILRRDTHGYGELRINIRVELRRFDPVLSSGEDHIMMGAALGDDASSSVIPWTDDAFNTYRQFFLRRIAAEWSARLSVVNTAFGSTTLRHRRDDLWGGNFPLAFRCSLTLTDDPVSPQLVILAVNLEHGSSQMRVYMCDVGGHENCGHGGRWGFLRQAGAEGWPGRGNGIDGILTSANLATQVTENWRVPESGKYGTHWQIVAVHELGHYLGLSHVNIGCSSSEPNAACEYGVGAYQRSDVMGAGDRFHAWHAWPWLNRLRQHAGLRWSRRRTNAGMELEGLGTWRGALVPAPLVRKPMVL